MFSSLTYEGARITLDALAAGALDFIPKDFAEVSRNSRTLIQKLHERLLTLGRQGRQTADKKTFTEPVKPRQAPATTVEKPRAAKQKFSRPKLLVIGASTGRAGSPDRGSDQIARKLSDTTAAGAAYAGEFHQGVC